MSAQAATLDVQTVLDSLPGLSPRARLFVAYSGGLDSTVLLHLLCQHGPRDRLRALHVDHRLQPQSGEWADHCRRQSEAWLIPFKCLPVTVPTDQGGLEAGARRARYRALFGAMGRDDVLLTAQHADDQAETLLLQLLRGAGPHGLAAMPGLTADAGHEGRRLIRPLLSQTRRALADYAARHRLEWIEDPSNARTNLRRNYLRHEVMPVLRERWPQAPMTLSRSAALCAEAATLMDELAAQDLAAVDDGAHPASLPLSGLQRLAPHRRRNVLRHWLGSRGLAVPTQAHLTRVEHDVVGAGPSANPCVAWADVEVRGHGGRLWAMHRLPSAPRSMAPIAWSPLRQRVVDLPDGCGRLVAEAGRGGLRLPDGPMNIVFRAGGERLRPRAGGPSRTLKHLCQEAGIPPWVRRRMPLVQADGSLVAVADVWVDAAWQARSDEPGLRLHWVEPPCGLLREVSRVAS